LSGQEIGGRQDPGTEQPNYFAIEQTAALGLRAESFVKIESLEHGFIPDPEDLDPDYAGSLDCARVTVLSE
jgi:hypothetical protein